MKVLIVPPEDFVPKKQHMSSIFQYHQGISLMKAGAQVMVVSVEESQSVKPLFLNLVRSLLGMGVHYSSIMGKGPVGIFRILLKTLLRRPKVASEELDGLHVVRVWQPNWSDITMEERQRYFSRCVQLGYSRIKRDFGRPDIIHAHNAWLAGSSVMEFSRQEGIPYCITEHSSLYERGIIPERLYPLIREVYQHARANFMVSHPLGRLLTAKGLLPRGYIHLPNIIDPIFEQAPMIPQRRTDVVTLLNVGSLIEVKAQESLIRAFAKAHAERPDLRLQIGGEGELRPQLEELISELGLAGKVTLLGMLGRRELLSRMQECNIFLLPSRVETFGVVIIEALSCGRPVIATRCGGPETILTEENGLLVPNHDIEALKDAMLEMASRLRDYDAEAIRRTVLERYSASRFATRLMSFFRDVLCGKDVMSIHAGKKADISIGA